MEICSHSKKREEIISLVLQHQRNYVPLEYALSDLLDKYLLVNVDEIQDNRIKLKWQLIQDIVKSISYHNEYVIKAGKITENESYSDLFGE